MATKDQEREALKKIEEIIESVGGKDSYICKAFEGCAEMARENIECDSWDSWKEIAERNQEEAEKWFDKADELKESLNESKSTIAEQGKTIGEWIDRAKAVCEQREGYLLMYQAETQKTERLENEILRLKAEIYDLLHERGNRETCQK